jgi:hypothetical protein
MPGVFLPALRWVTWRIASSFADRERTSSFCRFFTRAPSPAFAARKIRSWRRRTTASAAVQSTSDHAIGSRPSVCSAFAIQRLRSALASSSLASAETRRKSAPFRAGYFRCRGPVRPITGRPSLSPAILYPLRRHPSSRSGFHLAVGRVGLTLLPDGELRPGRLRPFVRRELVSPSPAVPSGDPARLPFGSGHQPLGPVLRYGL